MSFFTKTLLSLFPWPFSYHYFEMSCLCRCLSLNLLPLFVVQRHLFPFLHLFPLMHKFFFVLKDICLSSWKGYSRVQILFRRHPYLVKSFSSFFMLYTFDLFSATEAFGATREEVSCVSQEISETFRVLGRKEQEVLRVWGDMQDNSKAPSETKKRMNKWTKRRSSKKGGEWKNAYLERQTKYTRQKKEEAKVEEHCHLLRKLNELCRLRSFLSGWLCVVSFLWSMKSPAALDDNDDHDANDGESKHDESGKKNEEEKIVKDEPCKEELREGEVIMLHN